MFICYLTKMVTYKAKETLAVPDGSTTPTEADEEDETAEPDKDVGSICEALVSMHLDEAEVRLRVGVHYEPYAHTKNSSSRKLQNNRTCLLP